MAGLSFVAVDSSSEGKPELARRASMGCGEGQVPIEDGGTPWGPDGDPPHATSGLRAGVWAPPTVR